MFSFRTTSIFEQGDNVLKSGRVAILCNQVAWHPDKGEYLFETFSKRGNLVKIFMLEHSFYGEVLPAELGIPMVELTTHLDVSELENVDALIIELQDTGSRYGNVTKILLNLFADLKESKSEISIFIIDRLNPSGRQVEGTMGELGVPHRHGLTVGELANLFHSEFNAKFHLHIISANSESVNRELMPWSIPPFTDFSGLFTSNFYSGTCLYMGTNVSYGHGTTRPFECFGSPWMEPLFNYLKDNHIETWNAIDSPIYDKSLYIRWHRFIPAYGMYSGKTCFGFHFMFIPGNEYHALNHTLRCLRFIREQFNEFTSDNLEKYLEDDMMLSYVYGEIDEEMLKEYVKTEEQKWLRKAKKYILYDEAPYRVKS